MSTTRRGLSILALGAREQRGLFTLAVIGSLVYGGLTVADAWVLGWATDEVIAPSFAADKVLVGVAAAAAALFLTVAVFRALGVIGRRLIGGVVYYRLMADYRRRVTRQYLALPMGWHHAHPTGQLLSNANADVEATWQAMMPLPMAVGVIAMIVVGIVAMFLADPVLTIVGLVVFPLLFVINVGYQRYLSPRVTRAQALRAEVSEVAHESFDGALVVKTLGREEEETRRFAASAHALRDANIHVGRIRGVFDPVLEALPNIGILLVILVGVERVASGAADAGDVVQVAYLFTVIAFPVRAIGWVLGEIPRSVVGWERVSAVLEATGSMEYGHDEMPGGTAVSVAVRDVTYGYTAGRPVLRRVDVDVAAGRTVAVVGLTGSGKSTLASLLIRLADPDDGGVLLDGVDVRTLSHDSLAQVVALVPQQTFIFDDTVRDNITLSENIPDEQVWDALRVSQAERFVQQLPEGLDSVLGERGTTLSGGQRQRLALARALVRNPRLLLLDDATSAVDPEVEGRILGALRARTSDGRGPTVVVVAYRKATIALADEVLFLSEGHILDRGRHADLVQRSAAYRDIVDAYDQAREQLDHDGAPIGDLA